MANYREPQWLLPNEKNLAMPASDATVGSGLAEDRHSLYSMKFDGTEYIDINPGSSSTIDLTSFTISAWVKWTNSGNSYGTAIRLSTTGDDIWIYLGRSTGFNFGVRFFLGSTALDDTDFLPTNEWKHIVDVNSWVIGNQDMLMVKKKFQQQQIKIHLYGIPLQLIK